ncbi:MAG: hypothetical protein FJ144_12890 [Deltaproteobacteria bacterium]|nr:hypothetical protein [Deltaproteobacteria bacterium]
MAGGGLIPSGARWHVAALAVEMSLAVVIGVMLLAIAFAYNVGLDLTPDKEHTLSDQARRTAGRLEKDVTITAFYNSREQGRVREIKELLQRFQRESSHLQFKMYDLDRSPLLANRYGIANYDTAVIEGADRVLVVRNLDESGLTANLIKLIEGVERKALFTVGHGESDPQDPDERRGLSLVAKDLEAESYRIERSSDLRTEISPGVALLVIAGPRTDFTDSEIEVVRRYLNAGGGALILLEANAPPKVQALVRELGVVPGNDLVVDERNRLFFADSFAPQVAYFNEEILPYTGAPPAVLPLAQSMSVERPERADVENAPLAFTGADTWVDTDRSSVETERPEFQEGDRVGPVPVAAIAHVRVGEKGKEKEDTGGSIVVVGDASFATNLYSGQLGNKDLFLNMAHLAARAESLIAVRQSGPQGGTFSRIYLTAEEARVLFWTSVVLLPASVLLFGVFVGWRRRTRSAG